MNLKAIKGLQPQTKVQKEAIVFSSDDSMNSDNSFNSSVEEDETDDYKNTIFHLKEQMSQFFLANPGLQEDIKFDEFDFLQDENGLQSKTLIKDQKKDRAQTAMKRKNVATEKIKPLAKADYVNFSTQWKTLGKDVIRNSQGGQTLPTLDTINHRLNIFRQKVEKVDYLEILQKETQSKPDDGKQKTLQTERSSQPLRSQSENLRDEDETQNEDVQYFSFKKKMQLALHKRQQLQKEEEDRKQKIQKDKMKKGIGGINDSMSSDSPQKGVQQKNLQTQSSEKNMEFQTHVGQMLYQTYQQTGGDKESFKKMAAIFLKNYHKKQKENLEKMKVFPPVIPKFTSDDCKHLNLLLPDFTTQLFAPNKQNLFQGAENYKFSANSPEQEFMNLVDQILDGKVMQFWKEMHTIQ